MIKAIFFDIDGTLVSFNTHRIPQSAVDAISMAKAKGIKIYISTGRPFSLINNLDEIKHMIDGYITANGALCFSGDRIISCTPIPKEDVLTVLRFSDDMKFPCMVVGEKDLTMYNSDERTDRIFRRMLNVHNMREDNNVEQILQQRILQLTPVISVAEAEKLLRNGNYIAFFPTGLIKEKLNIVKYSLVYFTAPIYQYFIPYYCFYVELDKEAQADGTSSYGICYVPAISSAYIESMPKNGSLPT